MFKYETVVRSGRDAEHLTTAFYRFLELHGVGADLATVKTEVLGAEERRTVVLWSEDAVEDFQRFLRGFRLEPPRMHPRWPRRFDDLEA